MKIVGKIINDTEKLIKSIMKGAATISDKKMKNEAENWVAGYHSDLLGILNKSSKEMNALLYFKKTCTSQRLNKKKWLKNLRVILKSLKNQQIAGIKRKKIEKYSESYIFPDSLINKIKKRDKKIFVLGSEANVNWQNECWNSCGILMRIILERSLDKKDSRIKQKNGLKDKINFSLSTSIFSKSIREALKKLDHSTKITGDIVAHDSNILLSKNDIELAIVPLNMFLKDVFRL